MYSCLENPMDGGAWWATVHGVAKRQTRLSDFTFPFYFHALEKEMATHSSVLAWRIPGMGEPGGPLSMGLHRVGHDWSDLAAAGAFPLYALISCLPQCPWPTAWRSQFEGWRGPLVNFRVLGKEGGHRSSPSDRRNWADAGFPSFSCSVYKWGVTISGRKRGEKTGSVEDIALTHALPPQCQSL